VTFQAGAGRVDAEGVLEAFGRLGIEVPDGDDGDGEIGGGTVIVEQVPEGEHVWPPDGYLLPGPLRGSLRNAE
jgi:hypothetical protein